MSSEPMIRTGLLHAGSAGAGAIAAISFMSSHSVDIYAVWDQLNVVVGDITKLVGLITPLATGGYAVYKATTKAKLADLAKDDRVKGVVTSPELAAISGDKVVSTVAQLPPEAKAATA